MAATSRSAFGTEQTDWDATFATLLRKPLPTTEEEFTHPCNVMLKFGLLLHDRKITRKREQACAKAMLLLSRLLRFVIDDMMRVRPRFTCNLASGLFMFPLRMVHGTPNAQPLPAAEERGYAQLLTTCDITEMICELLRIVQNLSFLEGNSMIALSTSVLSIVANNIPDRCDSFVRLGIVRFAASFFDQIASSEDPTLLLSGERGIPCVFGVVSLLVRVTRIVCHEKYELNVGADWETEDLTSALLRFVSVYPDPGLGLPQIAPCDLQVIKLHRLIADIFCVSCLRVDMLEAQVASAENCRSAFRCAWIGMQDHMSTEDSRYCAELLMEAATTAGPRAVVEELFRRYDATLAMGFREIGCQAIQSEAYALRDGWHSVLQGLLRHAHTEEALQIMQEPTMVARYLDHTFHGRGNAYAVVIGFLYTHDDVVETAKRAGHRYDIYDMIVRTYTANDNLEPFISLMCSIHNPADMVLLNEVHFWDGVIALVKNVDLETAPMGQLRFIFFTMSFTAHLPEGQHLLAGTVLPHILPKLRTRNAGVKRCCEDAIVSDLLATFFTTMAIDQFDGVFGWSTKQSNEFHMAALSVTMISMTPRRRNFACWIYILCVLDPRGWSCPAKQVAAVCEFLGHTLDWAVTTVPNLVVVEEFLTPSDVETSVDPGMGLDLYERISLGVAFLYENLWCLLSHVPAETVTAFRDLGSQRVIPFLDLCDSLPAAAIPHADAETINAAEEEEDDLSPAKVAVRIAGVQESAHPARKYLMLCLRE